MQEGETSGGAAHRACVVALPKFGYKLRATVPVWKLERPVLLHNVNVCIVYV